MNKLLVLSSKILIEMRRIICLCSNVEPDIKKAIQKGSNRSVQFLLDNKFVFIDVNNGEDEEYLKMAVRGHHTEIFTYLYSLGCRIHDFQVVNSKPIDYEGEIFKACQEGKLTSIQWTLLNGEISQYTKDSNGNNLLHIAAFYGQLPIVIYLISKHNFDPNIRGESNMTALLFACISGYQPIVKYLIEHGADTTLKDDNLNSAIHFAAINGYLLIVKYLIERQYFSVNTKGYLNRTPIHYACMKNHYDIVNYLLSKGADVNAKDDENNTVLHYSAFWSKINIVKLLISKGATLNCKNVFNKLPYDLVNKSSFALLEDYKKIRRVLKIEKKKNKVKQ